MDGCPVVGPEKIELLKKFLLEKFAKIGPIVSHDFPLHEDKTQGYLFITYEDGKAAGHAVREMNNTALDKKHTLQVTRLSDYERCINVSPEWNPPARQEYKDCVCFLRANNITHACFHNVIAIVAVWYVQSSLQTMSEM